MTKANVSYTDFSAGEISPKLYGRFDLASYYSGHKRVENFIVDSVGQASFRNGFYYASKTAGNNPAFLWTFEFDDNLSFVLEFTNLKVRFYRNDGQVRETAQDITNITQANPAVVTYSGADNFTNGDSVFIEGVVGMTEVNGQEFTVANVDTGANTFELSGVDSSAYTAYSSGGEVSVITEVTTPYTTAQLFDLKFAQNNVDLYIVHPSHNPQKLTYTSPTSWAIASHSPTGLTLTADEYPSAVTFYEDRLIYGGSNDFPQTLFFSKSADPDDFTVGTEVDDGIEYTVSGSGNKIQWLRGTNKFLAIGAFGDVLQATGGIDDVITPDSISIKPSNSYGVANINPLGKNTNIFFMQRNKLVLRSFEFKFEIDSYIPVDRNVIADHITNTGVKQICFQEGSPNILWGAKNNGELIGMTIEESEGVSGWHRHETEGEFISVASMPRSNNDNQLWACVKRTIDGQDNYYIEYLTDKIDYPVARDFFTGVKATDLAKFQNQMFEAQKGYIFLDSALTFDGSLTGTNASASVTPAATSGTGITFTASASVFSANDVGRQIWKKSTTGAEEGRAEITAYTSATEVTCTILEEFDSTDAISAGDWYLTTDDVSGLSHLEGETVTVIADGGQHAQKTVSNSIINLDRECSVVHVGLGYEGWIETNSIEGGGTNGTAQTKRKSVNAVGVRFLNTMFGKVGTSYYSLEQIYERSASMKMDRPPLPYTGDKKITIADKSLNDYDGGWKREKNIIIQQDLPFPINVQLLVPYMNVSNV